MHIILLELSHYTTPLEIREKFALSEDGMKRLGEKLNSMTDISEHLILNTCNRVEVYVVCGNKNSVDPLIEAYCAFYDVEPAYFNQYVKIREDFDAVTHLFFLTSGLESQIVGETEILGQVKNAYATAQNGNSLGPILNKTFQKSFQSAKWIRSNTGIGKGQVSIGNVAVDLADRIFGELSKCRILIIGTGEIGQQTLKALKSRGVSSVTVASRTLGKARLIASEYNGVAIDFEHVQNVIQYFNIIICATASTLPIVTHKMIEGVMQERVDEPLFLIDQAVPRDIESSVGDITNVYLYNLDDLSNIANENLKTRKSELKKCKSIISEKASYTWDSLSNGQSHNKSAAN